MSYFLLLIAAKTSRDKGAPRGTWLRPFVQNQYARPYHFLARHGSLTRRHHGLDLFVFTCKQMIKQEHMHHRSRAVQRKASKDRKHKHVRRRKKNDHYHVGTSVLTHCHVPVNG